jgi:hypothetical protein
MRWARVGLPAGFGDAAAAAAITLRSSWRARYTGVVVARKSPCRWGRPSSAATRRTLTTPCSSPAKRSLPAWNCAPRQRRSAGGQRLPLGVGGSRVGIGRGMWAVGHSISSPLCRAPCPPAIELVQSLRAGEEQQAALAIPAVAGLLRSGPACHPHWAIPLFWCGRRPQYLRVGINSSTHYGSRNSLH